MEPKLLATPRAALQGALAALRPLAERYLHPLYAPAGYTLLGAVLAWCPGEAAPLLHRAAELHRSAEQRQMARAGPRLSPPKPAGKLKAKAAVFGRPPPLQQLPLPWPLVVRLARALSPRFLVPRAASVRAHAVFLLVRRPNLLAFRLSGGEHFNLLTASPDEFCRRSGCTPEELRKFERRWPG